MRQLLTTASPHRRSPASCPRRILLALALLLVGPGCAGEPSPEGRGEGFANEPVDVQDNYTAAHLIRATGTRSFTDLYEPVVTIRPEQSERHLIASVSDAAYDPARREVYVADALEANVKVFGWDGSLRRVLGRKGNGPGEFVQANHVELGDDGRVHVADTGRHLVQVFDADGELTGNVPLPAFGSTRDFDLLSDGSYVLVVGQPGGVLVRVDSTGEPISRTLEIAEILPEGQADDGIWSFARTFFLSVRNDTAFVITSVANLLWTVDLHSGDVSRSRIEFQGYDPPRVPGPEARGSARDAMADVMRHHLAGFIRTTDEEILIPFVQGEMMKDGAITLLHGSADGEWSVVPDSPIIVAAEGEFLVTVSEPATDAMTITLYRRRGTAG